MGFSGIGPGSLILILVIVILLFGTKKLRNMGGDLGSALKNFRKAVKDPENQDDAAGSNGQDKIESKDGNVIDAEVTRSQKDKAD